MDEEKNVQYNINMQTLLSNMPSNIHVMIKHRILSFKK